LRLLFENLASGANYYLDGSESLSEAQRDFVGARLAEIKNRVNITLTEPAKNTVIVEIRFVDGYENALLGPNELTVQTFGLRHGLLNPAALREAEKLATLASRHRTSEGILPVDGEALENLIEELGRSEIRRAHGALSGYGAKLSGQELWEYFRAVMDAQKGSELLIRPVAIFVTLGTALKNALWTVTSA
jgi:hypothetical protein